MLAPGREISAMTRQEFDRSVDVCLQQRRDQRVYSIGADRFDSIEMSGDHRGQFLYSGCILVAQQAHQASIADPGRGTFGGVGNGAQLWPDSSQ